MDTQTFAGTDVTAASRLLIHAAGDDDRDGWSIESIIQRMRSHVLDGRRNVRPQLALEIRDLLGHRVLALDDARPLIDITLPPGTYHVTAALGGSRRGYTIALEQGASFDLYLRLARDRH
jgi:hypothetical protein